MAAPLTILVADDDKFVRDDLADLLAPTGHQLVFAATGREALQRVAERAPDLVLLDLNFPDVNDLSVLQSIRAQAPETEVIIISAQGGDVATVVGAIKVGAYDFVPKPFQPDELLNRIQRALNLRALRQSQACLVQELRARDGLEALIGDSAPMRQVREALSRLALADGPVLIRGESGTGKELAARALHLMGARRAHPFVAVNCASIPESLADSFLFGHKRGAFTGAVDSAKGRFEMAGDGTIFLDEIGDMPLLQQAALLRVLEYRKFTPVGEQQERECRARFVFASNRDLRQAVSDGKFREDLFYRVNVANVAMPSLRSRPEDIPTLAMHYCNRFSTETGQSALRIASDAMACLNAYDWPGNVRELRNIIEAAVMLRAPGQVEITARDLPAEVVAGCGGAEGMSPANRTEKQQLINAFKAAKGNQSEMARILGCHRNTVRARMRSFGIGDDL